MIRTKAKGLLLSLMLVLACFCFFACKEETSVGVENISFVEKSISLLVGDEYSPEVKVLPSYASVRSYKLISSDSTALEVNGGTITALKSARGLKLKVVSDYNGNINDVISVDIYDEASELEIPTELKFDGNKFTFMGKDNVNAYMLKIGDQEINIGNNTEYQFDDLVGKVDELYNEILECSVKALGDGRAFVDSDYCEPISFVKLRGVDNACVEDEILYFDAIENVKKYNIEIFKDGILMEDLSREVINASFELGQLNLDISDLTNSMQGAEYLITITALTDDYNASDDVDAFVDENTTINYNVIGQVKQLSINNRIVSWNFVENAQNYSVEVYKDDNLYQTFDNISSNNLQLSYVDEGDYYCHVLANSNAENTTTGKIYSEKLNFTILGAPTISIDNNSIKWNAISQADGYFVNITNAEGKTLVNKGFVIGEEYDVSSFGAGKYFIDVLSCGNGNNIISSKPSELSSWIKLQNLQLEIKDEVLYWQDIDKSSLNKYHIKFDAIDRVLIEDDYDSVYNYDSGTQKYSYDLSTYDFEPNNYEITVQSLGEKEVFDADIDKTEIKKLANSKISGLSGNKFTINKVDGASNYKIEIYRASNLDSAVAVLDNIVSGNKFELNVDSLVSDNYIAKVLVYGNNKNVFDADNTGDEIKYLFEKLATPSLTIDSANLKVIVGDVANAEKYSLLENGVDKKIVAQEYDLSALSASINNGEYTYKVKAVGNGTTTLDSDFTTEEKKVKKLATPAISFDKNTLKYSVECKDEDIVGGYKFTINGDNISVNENQADCAYYIKNSNQNVFEVEVYANPEVIVDGFDLVIMSEVKTHNATRLTGVCDFKISNGKLIVSSTELLKGSGYTLNFKIENGENDIELTGFTYSSTKTESKFEIDIYDSKYNVISQLQTLMETVDEYEIYTQISVPDANTINSDVKKCESTLKTIDRVANINKNGQSIQFEIVDNAINYIAVIKVNGKEHYIDLVGNYNTTTVNVLEMDKLLQLKSDSGVPYKEQTNYEISFVSISDNETTIHNKGVEKYIYQFLKTPSISIVEDKDTNEKSLSIANEDENVDKYNVLMTQDAVTNSEVLTKNAGVSTTRNMDELTQFTAGNILVDVYASATTGDYFISKHKTITITKLDSVNISIVDGVLQWNKVNNAKQYNLVYTNATGGTRTMVLKPGVENFTISGSTCSYNFDTLESENTNMYIQIDSEVGNAEHYYLNSENGAVVNNIYKIPTPEIGTKNGEIYIEIKNTDLALAKNVELKVNNSLVDIDITKAQENVVVTPGTDKLAITINPTMLLTYGTTELLAENIALKIYAKASNTLNSSVGEKVMYGLLKPANLRITTSTINNGDAIEEVLEKIQWNNPSANSDYVASYEIIINYNSVDYVFDCDDTLFIMPKYYDANTNGKYDAGEIKFESGSYTIKVRSLTDNYYKNIVNSGYCDSISITILPNPSGLATRNGNIVWNHNADVGYYLVKVYLLEGENKTLIASSQSALSEFDMCALNPLETGVYGVTVRAMHDDSRILSSSESDMLQVIRLPQVESYSILNGDLYINMHSFFTRAEIYLTDKSDPSIPTKTFKIDKNALPAFDDFVENNPFTNWLSSTILDTYTSKDYIVPVKYEGEDKGTLRQALAQGYSISVKLFGNTSSKACIVSNHISNTMINDYWKDSLVDDKNKVEKLLTPNIMVSETKRGVVELSIPNGIKYSLNYYIDNENALQGVHLYEVKILTDEEHVMYVAEIVNNALFEESLTKVGNSVVVDGDDRNNLKHFEYAGKTFNVFDKTADNKVEFNFTTVYYHYYNVAGEYVKVELSNGGSFAVGARFMGDDSYFAKSNETNSVTIKRYSQVNLGINKGELSWANQASDEDHPIYLINLINEKENYNLVLYNPNIEYEDGKQYNEEYLLKSLDNTKTYIFDTISYSWDAKTKDETIVYKGLADIINNIRKENGSGLVNLGGIFQITIKAHYTDSSSMDIVLAQNGDTRTVAVLPQSQVYVEDGLLKWNMSYVSDEDYVTDYLLEIFNDNNKLYEITLKSGDYSKSNNVATYEFGRKIDGDKFEFTANSIYKFKITALGAEGKTYINSIVSETADIRILPDLQEVKMNGGKLVWTNPTNGAVEIFITYQSGDSTIAYSTIETENDYFDLPISFIDVSGTYHEFVSGIDYTIKARLKGATTTINGFFSAGTSAQRLATVNKDSIVTKPTASLDDDDRILTLTWEAIPIEGTTYTIKYTTQSGGTYETAKLNTNSFDFAGIESGIIQCSIYAHNNSHFSSLATSSVEVFKLSIPTNITYQTDSTTITWDKITDKNGNWVENYQVSIVQEGFETQEYVCLTNSWTITGIEAEAFSVAVRAISTELNTRTINSDYSSYVLMSVPNQVDVATLEFDEALQAFKWKAIENEQPGDKYYIGFNYYDKILEPNEKADAAWSGDIEVTISRSVNVEGGGSEKYYYFYPHMVGTYRLVYVQVKRAESLSSQKTEWIQSQLEFDLFAAGDGSDANPYQINTEYHLRNIKYFLDAHYVLIGNINLLSNEPITDETQVFTGSIDGGMCSINGIIQIQEYSILSQYEGLFNRVKGAVFKDLTLSNFNIKGYIGAANSYIGILVGKVEGFSDGETIVNTTFNNITIKSSELNIIKNNSNGYTSDMVDIYVGMVAGYAENAEFRNCVVSLGGEKTHNVTVSITGNSNTEFVLGGIVGYADNVVLANNSNSTDNTAANGYVIQLSTTNNDLGSMYVYTGALVGETGENVNISGNKCKYAQYSAGNTTEKTNEIGVNG